MLRNINLIKRLIMNEIQKFKKGRMIPKHQDGGGMYSASDLVEAGNRAFG